MSGYLVVVLAVVGLHDPQRALQHVHPRPGVSANQDMGGARAPPPVRPPLRSPVLFEKEVKMGAREVRDGDGDLVVVLAVMGLLDPQRTLQHVLLRPGVPQDAVGNREVRKNGGHLAVVL